MTTLTFRTVGLSPVVPPSVIGSGVARQVEDTQNGAIAVAEIGARGVERPSSKVIATPTAREAG